MTEGEPRLRFRSKKTGEYFDSFDQAAHATTSEDSASVEQPSANEGQPQTVQLKVTGAGEIWYQDRSGSAIKLGDNEAIREERDRQQLHPDSAPLVGFPKFSRDLEEAEIPSTSPGLATPTAVPTRIVRAERQARGRGAANEVIEDRSPGREERELLEAEQLAFAQGLKKYIELFDPTNPAAMRSHDAVRFALGDKSENVREALIDIIHKMGKPHPSAGTIRGILNDTGRRTEPVGESLEDKARRELRERIKREADAIFGPDE